ncbi:hypothetical protein [Microbacterium sp. SD291]|uniref:hypothetical protein n=1 Tax=Microbacterium sp. SD291 TaxID=2782007 RepID=UPI001F616843|nr:hypothetical protein [Microbacterium sp. SD291]
MVTVDPAALSQLLGAVDLRVGIARRVRLETGTLLPLAPGSATLVYLAAGSVRGHPPLNTGCRLDVDRASHVVAVDLEGSPETLSAGDAFLSLGRKPIALDATADSELVVVELELSDTASTLSAVLPDLVTVTGFDALEPAAAALARNMGPAVETACPSRQATP